MSHHSRDARKNAASESDRSSSTGSDRLSQVARGYAIGRGTPPVVARLFGLPGVPDPCFWLVVEYAWLGDWRRP